MFQSTHPYGVRQGSEQPELFVFEFQSTHPYGVRHYPGYAIYGSFTEAMHNAYKDLYLGKYKWREVTTKGMKATYSAATLMRHLTPVYKFTLFSQTHKIHSVRKSLMNNESVLVCLVG